VRTRADFNKTSARGNRLQPFQLGSLGKSSVLRHGRRQPCKSIAEETEDATVRLVRTGQRGNRALPQLAPETLCKAPTRAIQARLNKGTCGSTKRSEVRTDQLGMGLHLSKDAGQCGDQGVQASKEAIVCPVLARVLP
jgi:hypothetical protein